MNPPETANRTFPPPLRHHLLSFTPEDPEGDVIQRPEPSKHPRTGITPTPGMTFFEPSIHKPLQRHQRRTYQDIFIQDTEEVEDTHVSAPGPAGRQKNAPKRSEYNSVQNTERNERFEEVLGVVQQLADKGYIQDWSVVPNPKIHLMRGRWPVWRIPARERKDGEYDRRYSWAFLDKKVPEYGSGRRRAALVCEVMVDGNDILWIELERREGESGFRYVMGRVGTKSVEECVERALRWAEHTSGHWPPVATLCDAAGLDNAIITQHTYITERKEDGSVLELLNEMRIIEKIYEVANGVTRDEYRKR